LDDPCPQFQSTPEYLWLITLSRYVSILFENLLIIEGLSEEVEQHVSSQETQPWLEKLLFKLSENERKRLSADLHHGALQEQIVWYRKLQMLSSDSSIPQHVRQSINEILEGLLDVIYQIRITCTELRPAMLQEFGLVSSLEYLFEQAQLRSDFSVEFDCTEWKQAALNDEHYITLYRIVQELLTNADKHSYASRVNITLSNGGKHINLSYSDNGIGANIEKINHATEHLGITGIRHRVTSLNGTIELKSEAGQGLEYYILIPLNRNES
jgi:two-component system sensor histidine kinase ComP